MTSESVSGSKPTGAGVCVYSSSHREHMILIRSLTSSGIQITTQIYTHAEHPDEYGTLHTGALRHNSSRVTEMETP